MRKALILLALIPILALFNFAIWDKEAILRDGQLLLLDLAPVDPRSLMQGDYMRLRYQVAIEAKDALVSQTSSTEPDNSGHLVLKRSEDGRASFVRFHASEPLAEGEILLPYRKKGTRFPNIVIQPDSYFFQEGQAKLFEAAKFGLFKLRDNGSYLLIGLADGEGRKLGK